MWCVSVCLFVCVFVCSSAFACVLFARVNTKTKSIQGKTQTKHGENKGKHRSARRHGCTSSNDQHDDRQCNTMAGTALGALGNNGAKQQQLNKRTQKVQAAQQAMPTDSNETLDNDINHIAFEARAKQDSPIHSACQVLPAS